MVVWNSYFFFLEKEGNGWMLYFRNWDFEYVDIVIVVDGVNFRIWLYLIDIWLFYIGIMMIEGVVRNVWKNLFKIYEMLVGGKIMVFGKL